MWLTNGGRGVRSPENNLQLSDLSDSESNDDDSVDPRVQEELERLNNSTDAINKLEVELDESRAAFRQLLSDSSQRINSLAKKLGSCVEKARPYYEARMKAKEVHAETQKAALRFERANSALSVAKEMVFLAEEGLGKEGRTFDPAWQEMLNHATMRVNEAERERTLSEQEHKKTSKSYNEADTVVKELQKELKKNITKSSLSARRNMLQLNDLAHQHQLILLPYFEMKGQFNKMLEQQKRQVQELEESVLKAKLSYADALHNLEEISDEIHQKRKLQEERRALGVRGHGVGAENPEQSKTFISNGAENLFCKDAIQEDYLTLPSKLKLLKSSSSSTLSQSLNSQATDNQMTNSNKLRKSMSVVDRTEVSPLFGRYSISRNNKLQIDHSSQTDDDLLKTAAINPVIIEPSSVRPLQCDTTTTSPTVDIPTEIDLSNKSAISSSKSSVQSSETSSPSGSFVINHTKGLLSLTNSIATSLVSHDDGEMSDTESLASIDVLTDDQISNLMIEKELEDAVQNMKLNGKEQQQQIDQTNQQSLHQMTQTYSTLPCDSS